MATNSMMNKGGSIITTHLGQLVKLTKGDQTLASYRYNANYQRVQKTIGKATTYYHYNQQGQLLQENQQNNKASVTSG